MKVVVSLAVAAVAIAFSPEQVQAQPVYGCPAGQAMQSSDPSGRKITCVPVGGGESDIIGTWAVTGSTNCLVSSNGFDPNLFIPLVPTVGNTFVSHLSGSFLGTRTFYAGGTGRAVGTTHTLSFPATGFGTGVAFPSTNPGGGASVTTLDAPFTWTIQSDGTLRIDDDSTAPQPFTMPSGRLGWTATVSGVPPYVGHISKDKRTIEMTHLGMGIETGVIRNAAGVVQSSAPRFCARSRVLTRIN